MAPSPAPERRAPSALARVACVCAALFLLYTVLLTIAFLDFDRPDIRAACPAFDPFAAALVLVVLSQLAPVVTLSHYHLPDPAHRLATNATWLLLMVVLLVTAHTQDRRLRDRPCFDEIYRPRAGQLTGTAAVVLPVAFFALLMQAVLALLYAILLFHDLRALLARSAEAAPPTPGPPEP